VSRATQEVEGKRHSCNPLLQVKLSSVQWPMYDTLIVIPPWALFFITKHVITKHVITKHVTV